MKIYLRHIVLFFLLFVSLILFSQKSNETLTTIDSITGNKKVVFYTYIGTGGGYGGDEPRITRRTITKYDKQNKLIYKSYKTTRLRGCMRSTPKWNIIAYDSAGGYKKFKLKHKRRLILKSFDKNGKRISKTNDSYSTFSYDDWMDEEEDN